MTPVRRVPEKHQAGHGRAEPTGPGGSAATLPGRPETVRARFCFFFFFLCVCVVCEVVCFVGCCFFGGALGSKQMRGDTRA